MKKTIPLLLALFMTVFACGYASASEQPEIFVQMGHTGSVTAVALSPDGRHVLTGDVDGNIKLWDAAGGFEIRTYTGQHQRIFGLHFSPDGKLFLSNGHGGDKPHSILWEIATGRQIRKFEDASGAFSSDGRKILLMPEVKTDWSERTFSVWDLSLDKQNVISQFNPPEDMYEYAFSDDGRYALVLTKDGHLVLWDMRAQQKLKTFQGKSESAHLIRRIRGALRAVFSPDYKHVVTWSNYSPSPGEPQINHYIELWDMATGTKKTLKGHTDRIEAVVFSADSRYLVTPSVDGSIRLWETAAGREVRTFGAAVPKDAGSGREWFTSIAFSANSKHILSGSGNEAKLWDVATGKMKKTYTGQAQGVLSVVLSPDGRKAVLGKNDGSIDICDLSTGNIIKVMQAHHYGVHVLSVSSDGTRLLSGSSDQTLKLWEFPTLKPLKTFSGFPHWVEAAAFSSDGRYAVSGDGEGYLRLFDLQSDQEIRAVRDHNRRLQHVAFSPDGKYVLSRGFPDDNHTGSHWIRLWNAADLTLVREIGWGLIAGDGKHALVMQSKGPFGTDPPRPFSIVDVFNPKEEKIFTVGGFPLAVSPNQHYVLSKDSGNRVMFYDTTTHRTHLSSSAHLSDVNAAAFSSDDKFTLSASDDGTARLWETASGREMARMISFTDGEWIVITPEGYYTGSEKADQYVSVRIGNNVYGVGQYREKFYRPEVVMAALAGKPITNLASLTSVKPAPSVSIVETPASVGSDEATVKVKVADAGGGIGDVRLYLNGSAVVLDRTRNLAVAAVQGKAQVFSYKVRLVSGKNSLRAIAFNAGNSMQSTDATHEIEAKIAAKKPSLHALVIGIQDYENPKLTLKYPVADAKLMAATLRERAPGLFEGVNVVELTTRAQTTKDAITKTLKEMSGKVRPDDLFVFFVASHGTVDDGEYFLITSNVGATSTHILKQTALSQDDLKALIANVPATKKLVLIDTCNAGKLGEAIQIAMLTRGMNEDTALKILSRAVGSTILSASNSVQEALEGYKDHGLFTYVVVDGLRGAADNDKDGYVKTHELVNYVDSQVPELAEQVFRHKQYPTTTLSGQGFPVVRVK